MMNPFMLKMIAGLGAVLMIGLLVADRNNWRGKANDRQETIAATCAAVRAAVGKPKLDCKQVDRQVGLMGNAMRDLTGAVGRQTEAVNRLSAETARAKAEGAEASRQGAERARTAERSSGALAASSRASGRTERPCEPSEALKESWR